MMRGEPSLMDSYKQARVAKESNAAYRNLDDQPVARQPRLPGMLLICAFLILITGAGFAQPLPQELTQAQRALSVGQPSEALRISESYIAANPRSDYVLAARLLAGRAELALDRVDDALMSGYRLLDAASVDSPYRADAHYLIATAHEARGNHVDAARELVAVLDANPSSSLQEQALDHLDQLLDGPAAYRANELMLAARNEGTRRMLRRLLPVSANIPVIGLLLPNEESEWEHADDFIAGVEAALAVWELDGGQPVQLEIERVAAEPTRAVMASRKLVREFGVWALIAAGSEELTVPVAVEAQAAGVPVLLPGQGRTALEGIGPSVVRTVADWRLEGELAATYAADVLGIKVFGIVAPYTDQGRENVAGFLDVLEQREDIEILDQEWYRPEEGVSLANQFRNLRTIGFKREFREELIVKELARLDSIATAMDSLGLIEVDARVDSLEVTIVDTLADHIVLRSLPIDSLILADEDVEREWEQHLIEARQTIEFKTGNIDSNAIALDVFEALYLPIEPNTLNFFSPQFAFYEFNTIRFGNSAWYQPDELLRHKQYVEKVVLTTMMNLQANNEPMLDLYGQVSDTMGTAVAEWHVHGYDAMRLVLCAMTDGHLNDEELVSREIVREGPLSIAMGLRRLKEASLASGSQRFADESPVGLGSWLMYVDRGVARPLFDGLMIPDSLTSAEPPEWALPLLHLDSDTLDGNPETEITE